MPDLSKHPILRQIHDLIGAIEVCGASPALTRAVCLASDLYEPVGALVDAAACPAPENSPATPESTEQLIRVSGAEVAPRVTPAAIDALCADLTIHTHHIPGTTAILAAAVLPDGFVVATGYSACISAANFKAEIGERIAGDNARAAARAKLWELEGYVLRASIRDPEAAFASGIMAATS